MLWLRMFCFVEIFTSFSILSHTFWLLHKYSKGQPTSREQAKWHLPLKQILPSSQSVLVLHGLSRTSIDPYKYCRKSLDCKSRGVLTHSPLTHWSAPLQEDSDVQLFWHCRLSYRNYINNVNHINHSSPYCKPCWEDIPNFQDKDKPHSHSQ